MEGECQQLARLVGRLGHPGCSLNVLTVMALSFYLSLPRGAWARIGSTEKRELWA